MSNLARLRAVFRYSERVMRHIQLKTWQKLDSVGVKLEKITQLKQWNIGEYYGSPGRDVQLVKS
ncbi:TPA: hypothetical protein HL444_19645 [Escherichia coli]|nr:hypothetical protein [Escherichia coli]